MRLKATVENEPNERLFKLQKDAVKHFRHKTIFTLCVQKMSTEFEID